MAVSRLTSNQLKRPLSMIQTFFFFNDPATTEIYTTVHTLSLHDALPIFSPAPCPWRPLARAPWQLRGMATGSAVRGSGAGRLLVIDGLERVTARGGDLV